MSVEGTPDAQETGPLPGTPEYIQRYAQLACERMGRAMQQHVETREGFDPTTYTGSQVVTPQAAVFYLQGPHMPVQSGESTVPSSKSLKIYTHPPTQDISQTREFTYEAGRPNSWVTVQRGFGFPDANLTSDELAYLQIVAPEVDRMAEAEADE